MEQSGEVRQRTTARSLAGSYRDLRVWQDAMTLVEGCYLLRLPKEETFGMASQIRRASSSIAANIAEGYGRELNRPFIHFLRIAQGSLKELETPLILIERVRMAPPETVAPLLTSCEALGKMLRSLIRARQTREVEA